MTYLDAHKEREDALLQDSMDDATHHGMALSQYAAAHGAEDHDRQWILTPYDSWEINPFYNGPGQPHPEDDSWREEDGAAEPVDVLVRDHADIDDWCF